MLFICSLTVLPDYRLLKQPSYPGIASDYKKSIATLRGLPCDIFLGSHGQFFGMQAKIAKLGGAEDPFIDPAGCRAYIDDAAKAVDDEIVKEQATQ